MNKKLMVFLFILSLSLSFPLLPATAATKAGTKCNTAGIKSVLGNKTFTCIKSGSKLIWDKGTSIPTQVISVANTPKAEKSTLNNFTDLRSMYLEFHSLAWKKAMEQISKTKENPTQIFELVGPNSKKCTGKIIEAIRTTQKLYAATNLPVTLKILYADKGDEDWLYQETQKHLRSFELTMQGNVQVNPHSVNAQTKEAVEWVQDSCAETQQTFLDGSAAAHGYTHSIQKMQFTNSDTQWGLWGKAPRWLLEGGATFSDQIIMYKNDESRWMEFLPRNIGYELRKMDVELFNEYFNSDDWQPTEKFPNQLAYELGFMVCEILVAMKGPSILIDLYADLSQTQDFDLTFKNKFGVTWKQASPDVANAVYKYIKNWVP